MKILAVLLVVGCITGCAVKPTVPAVDPRPLAEVERLKYLASKDCRYAERVIASLNEDLRVRGLANSRPENLTDTESRYVSHVKTAVWSLRIGCNNPNLYMR